MGVIKASVSASQTLVGREEMDWNAKDPVFIWMPFHVEMLILGPQEDKKRK